MTALRKERTPPGEAAPSAPFFIVGAFRSGSTLLRMMLSSHSRLTIPPETWYLIPLVRQFPIDRPLHPAEIESVVSTMTTHYRWPDMKLDAREFRRRVSLLTEPYLRDLPEVVYRSFLDARGKVRWADKSPPYIEIVPELARMYPGARFIHLFRDGRDVTKSFHATGWAGSRWLHDSTRQWTRALEWHWRWVRSEFRDLILPVRYEQLVLETEPTLREICRFVGEEFESQMLAWGRIVDDELFPREVPYHGKLKQRMGAEGVARWMHELSARETFVCESFMGSHLRRLGYPLRYSSPLWRPAFGLTRLGCTTLLPAYDSAARFRRRLLSPLRST